MFKNTISLQFDTHLLAEVRDALDQNLVLGNVVFKDDVKVILPRRVRLCNPDPEKQGLICRPAVKSSDIKPTPNSK